MMAKNIGVLLYHKSCVKESRVTCHILGKLNCLLMRWTLIQYKDVLPISEISLQTQDGNKIILSPQWEFQYW